MRTQRGELNLQYLKTVDSVKPNTCITFDIHCVGGIIILSAKVKLISTMRLKKNTHNNDLCSISYTLHGAK